MSEPTEIDLDALEALTNAATKAPWHVEYFGDRGYPQRISTAAAVIVADTHWGGGGLAPDAEFIAAARDALPALIAEVRQLREQLDASLKRECTALCRDVEEDRDALLPVVEAARAWRQWFPHADSMFAPENTLMGAVDAFEAENSASRSSQGEGGDPRWPKTR